MPKSTVWSTLCKGDLLHCMRQIVVTPDTDFWSTLLPFFKDIGDEQMHIPNHVKSID
jgi:hypothetical protein